jgi:hypothetical protein
MFYSGSAGELLIGGKKAGRVAAWSFSTSLGLLDTTSLADTDRSTTAGVRSTTGSCTLFYYAEDPTDKSTNDASLLLNKLIKQRLSGAEPNRAAEAESVVLRLRVNDGTTQGKFVEGRAWLTSVGMSMGVGAVLSAECAFEFTGALTGVDI